MTSVADNYPDVDDGLEEISPELVLVDPELARRLREREPRPVRDDTPPARALRLVPPYDAVVRGQAPPPSLRPEVEPATHDALDASEQEEAQPALQGFAEPEPVLVEPEVAVEPEPSQEPPDAPVPAPVVDVRTLLLPGAAEPADEPVRVVPIPAPEEATAVIPKPIDVVPASGTVTPEPAAAPALGPPEPALAAPSPAATQEEPAEWMPPAPRSRRRRGRRLLAFVLATGVATAAAIGVLTVMDRSPVSRELVSSWPVVGDEQSDAAKSQVAKRGKVAKQNSAAARSIPETQSSTPTARPMTQPKAATKPPTASAATLAPRRLVWVPVAGAVGYHVEIFRGAERILARDTKRPVVELDQAWRHKGRVIRLTDGKYRWYVWPLTTSGRGSQAIVHETISVA